MYSFRIAAAQIASTRGDLCSNIDRHRAAIEFAAEHEVSVLVFPELSLIGYEPDLAATHALKATDHRLAELSRFVFRRSMQVVIGAPIVNEQGKPYLGAFVFPIDGAVVTYAKMHLGGNEPDYFTPGRRLQSIQLPGELIGLSICADSSQSTHPAAFASRGATVYAASVFLDSEWYATDSPRFARIASDFGMLVLMANHAASSGTRMSVGTSAAWAPDGSLLACANGTEEALVMATRTGKSWTGEVVTM